MTRSSTTKLYSIGVDVGSTNGAISVVDEELNIHLLTKAPTYQTFIKSRRNKSKLNKDTMKYEKDYRKCTWVDFNEIGKILLPFSGNRNIYTIEKITARPGEGEPVSFMNGNSMGIFQAMNSIVTPIAYYEPLPAEWKKKLGVTSDKSTSIKLAEDIYQINLRNYLSKGKLDDVAEALLIAFYGLTVYYDSNKGD